jgi:exopolysaccharide biosynthesis polyprenyl glycosylphosphotransferase
MFLVSSYFFWSRSFFFSRFVLVSGAVITFSMVVLVRVLIDEIKNIKIFNKSFQKDVVLVGLSNLNKTIYKRLENDGEYNIVKTFTENKKVEDIKNYIETEKVYEIIQTDVGTDKDFDLELLDYCQTNNIQYNFIPGIIEFHSTLVDIKLLSNTPLISLKQTPLDGIGRVFKRLFDVCFSILALVLLSPIFLIVALLIKTTSKGPVFVSLKRVRLRSVFNIYKFRSMIDNAHQMKKDLMDKNERGDGPLFKMKKDPRVTRLGSFLRKTRIDEIPQFYNVLIGDMSVVGPRPHEPEEVLKYKKHHKKLLSIKPGITGMAQTSGASDLNFEDEVRLDTYYIENWSLWLDIKIIFKTVIVVFIGKGAV